eukprot:TRINITY_DN5280_c0_g1_i1.p1 TRINITY_DN5280_c0_g1~~TRINITY_DN5280_c0_g1_i1.p1  ORF type:complete len:117 (+),score=20.74 TRINITY_DN5280_c0_g1_i1:215-565(+)
MVSDCAGTVPGAADVHAVPTGSSLCAVLQLPGVHAAARLTEEGTVAAVAASLWQCAYLYRIVQLESACQCGETKTSWQHWMEVRVLATVIVTVIPWLYSTSARRWNSTRAIHTLVP